MTADARHEPLLTFAESGSGPTILVLHGGGGPATVAGIAEHLSRCTHVLTPTHPGWNGTPRPDRFDSITDLANTYLRTPVRRRNGCARLRCGPGIAESSRTCDPRSRGVLGPAR